jgi:hypothetical protein
MPSAEERAFADAKKAATLAARFDALEEKAAAD